MSDYPKSIEEDFAKLDKMREESTALRDVAFAADDFVEAFTEMKLTVEIIRWTAQKPFVCLRCEISRFDDLIPVFRELAKRGWHTNKAEPFDDYHEIDRRTYNLLQEGEGIQVYPRTGDKVPPGKYFQCRLRLMAFIRAEGATCRKVQVGVKEEPVYEFVCSQ